MSQAAYPTVAQVDAFLASQGFTTATPGTSYHLADAIARWESLTGYKPFLGDTSSASWYFDSPGSFMLDLKGGFWAVTSVAVGINYSDDTGTALVLNQDYELLPLNAANEGRGWDQIRLLHSIPVGTRAIKIVGKRGYAEEIPDDAFNAILMGAASSTLLEAMQGSAPMSEIDQGPVRYRFDNEAGRSKYDRWKGEFNKVAARYRRIGI